MRKHRNKVLVGTFLAIVHYEDSGHPAGMRQADLVRSTGRTRPNVRRTCNILVRYGWLVTFMRQDASGSVCRFYASTNKGRVEIMALAEETGGASGASTA